MSAVSLIFSHQSPPTLTCLLWESFFDSYRGNVKLCGSGIGIGMCESTQHVLNFLDLWHKKGPKLQSQAFFLKISLWLLFWAHFEASGDRKEQRDGANLQQLFLAVFTITGGKKKKNKKVGKLAAANGHTATYIHTGCFDRIGTRPPWIGTRGWFLTLNNGNNAYFCSVLDPFGPFRANPWPTPSAEPKQEPETPKFRSFR